MPKIITRDEIVEKIKEYQGFWKVPYKLIWEYDPKKRKRYLLTCKCEKKVWVSWRHIQQGGCMGCRSCRRQTHGLRYEPLYLSWHHLRRKRRPLVPEWQDFQTFETWAKELYTPGWKIVRIDSNLPYGPDNCDYMPVRRKKATGELLIRSLPVGKQTTLKSQKTVRLVG